MEFRKILALRGPNIWANFPVLEAWVDLGALKDSPSDELPGFNDRLMAWLPTMIEHRCSIGERGGFFERLRRGTYQAHVLEHVTLELQSLAGKPMSASAGPARRPRTASTRSSSSTRKRNWPAPASQTARELCLAAVDDRPFDVAAEVERLRDLAHRGPARPEHRGDRRGRAGPGASPSAGSTPRAWSSSATGPGSGGSSTAETDRTGAIAESIAQDKDLTRELAPRRRRAGPRGPAGRATPRTPGRPPRRSAPRSSSSRSYGNQGRGVATNLTTREQVAAAYADAREEGRQVVVERFAPGDDYRVLVVGGQVVAAARREPGPGRRRRPIGRSPSSSRRSTATPAAATITPRP